MRDLEHEAYSVGLDQESLIHSAGLAVSDLVDHLLTDLEYPDPTEEVGTVLILIGPGKNGLDGMVAAKNLANIGYQVVAYVCLSSLNLTSFIPAAEENGVLVITSDCDFSLLREHLTQADLIIDAILGTGNNRKIEEPLSTILDLVRTEQLKQDPPQILAVDIPTGINADSGSVDSHHIVADITLSLGFPKFGQFLSPAAEYTGRLFNASIGIPPTLSTTSPIEISTVTSIRPLLGRRAKFSHKGTFGKALVIAGSSQYIGAAYLACIGSLRTGLGYVTLGSLATNYPILSAQLIEATHLIIPEASPGSPDKTAAETILELSKQYDALLIGCGLGNQPGVEELVGSVLLSNRILSLPVVVDADGLTHLSKTNAWWEKLTSSTIITPHPGEMATLTGIPISEIQNNRAEYARKFSSEWGVIIVLKGAYTIIASPDGRQSLNPIANPILATAGTGDVLAGIITGQLAQGLKPFEAALSGVFIHSISGELLSKEMGDRGGIATDLICKIPHAIKAINDIRENFRDGIEEIPMNTDWT